MNNSQIQLPNEPYFDFLICILINISLTPPQILPKTRMVYSQNGGDVKIVLSVLACVSKILNMLDKAAIIDEVMPLLFEVKLQDVNVLVRVLGEIFIGWRAR